MPPVRLTDQQFADIMRAAQPLQAADREAFLRAVADRLRDVADLGDGQVARVCRELQHEFLHPPQLTRTPSHPSAGHAAE
jgi:hypothetical protein